MPSQCRTCGGVIYNGRPKNLFKIENATILLNLLQVTGARIASDPALPSYICACCLVDLKRAIVFRERCLQTQKDLLQRDKSPKQKFFQEETDDQVGEEEKEEKEVMVEKVVQEEEELVEEEEEEEEVVDEEEVEEEEEEEEEDVYEAQQEQVNGKMSVDYPSDTEDDFLDEFDACLGVEEEPDKADEGMNVPKKFEAIYETDPEEFHKRISEAEDEEDCSTVSSRSASPVKPRQQGTDDLQEISEDETEVQPDCFTDSSCPVSPVQTASVKTRLRGRPRGSTAKPNSGHLDSKATPAKPRQKKPYVTWKNMTEEQIVERKRQQRMRNCVCEQCGRHFTDQSNFKLHMLRHTGIRNFACDDCDKRFYTDHLLSLHQRIVHRGERPYSCRFCTKTFHNSTTRVIHERIHTKARPYRCSHCDKTFSSASGRKRHELIHTGVRAYNCSVCEQSFQRKTHLKAHLGSKLHALRAESNEIKEEVDLEEKLN